MMSNRNQQRKPRKSLRKKPKPEWVEDNAMETDAARAAAQPSATDKQADGDMAGERGQDVVAELREENAELKDKALRLLAEMENLRRRSEKSVKDAGQFAIARFARDMLEVNDNLMRAVESVSHTDAGAHSEEFKSLLEGVQLTQNALRKGLEKHGIAPIDALGEKFDPNFHEAMFEIPDENAVHGTVVQVIQGGFRIKDRVLRPAMVGIAKGGVRDTVPDTAREAQGPTAEVHEQKPQDTNEPVELKTHADVSAEAVERDSGPAGDQSAPQHIHRPGSDTLKTGNPDPSDDFDGSEDAVGPDVSRAAQTEDPSTVRPERAHRGTTAGNED